MSDKKELTPDEADKIALESRGIISDEPVSLGKVNLQDEHKKTIIEDMSNLYPIHLWVFKNQEELELKVPLYVAQLHQQLDRLDRLNAFL